MFITDSDYQTFIVIYCVVFFQWNRSSEDEYKYRKEKKKKYKKMFTGKLNVKNNYLQWCTWCLKNNSAKHQLVTVFISIMD